MKDEIADKLESLNGHFLGMYKYFDEVSDTSHMERLRLTEDDVHRYHFISYVSPGDEASRPLDNLKTRIRRMLIENPDQSVEYTSEYAKDLELAFFAVKSIADRYKADQHGTTLSKIFMSESMGTIFPLLMASWSKFHENP